MPAEKIIPAEPTIEDIVKGLILMPTYKKAVRYIYRHKDILFGDEARNIFDKLISSNTGEFGKQIQKVLDLLDECRVIKIDEMLAKRKVTSTE